VEPNVTSSLVWGRKMWRLCWAGSITAAALWGLTSCLQSSTTKIGGELALPLVGQDYTTGANMSCQGYGEYSDVTSGLPITITTTHGVVVARTTLSTGYDSGGVCDLDWSAVVPKAASYMVAYGDRGTVTFTISELRSLLGRNVILMPPATLVAMPYCKEGAPCQGLL
jgi:hypothetical protein